MKKYLPQKIGLFGTVFPTLLCGIGCGAAAFFAYKLLDDKLKSVTNLFISVIIGAVFYVILLVLTGVFRTNGIIKRKNEKNFQKTLAKQNKIG